MLSIVAYEPAHPTYFVCTHKCHSNLSCYHLITLLGSIMSGVRAPSILSGPGVGPLLDPVSISSPPSLLGVKAGEGRAELGVEPGLLGMLSRRPAVTAGWPGTRGPIPIPICCIAVYARRVDSQSTRSSSFRLFHWSVCNQLQYCCTNFAKLKAHIAFRRPPMSQ